MQPNKPNSLNHRKIPHFTLAKGETYPYEYTAFDSRGIPVRRFIA